MSENAQKSPISPDQLCTWVDKRNSFCIQCQQAWHIFYSQWRHDTSESLLGDEHCGRLDRRERRRLRVSHTDSRRKTRTHEDCYAGLKWVGESLTELQIDQERLMMSGMSAEGGLAASLALLVRDRGGPAIYAQLLICPMLNDRNETVLSKQYVSEGT